MRPSYTRHQRAIQSQFLPVFMSNPEVRGSIRAEVTALNTEARKDLTNEKNRKVMQITNGLTKQFDRIEAKWSGKAVAGKAVPVTKTNHKQVAPRAARASKMPTGTLGAADFNAAIREALSQALVQALPGVVAGLFQKA